jgi:hypothetical protein
MAQTQRLCKECGQNTLHAKDEFAFAWGCLLTILTGGLFIPIWVLISFSDALAAWRCQTCGKKSSSLGLLVVRAVAVGVFLMFVLLVIAAILAAPATRQAVLTNIDETPRASRPTAAKSPEKAVDAVPAHRVLKKEDYLDYKLSLDIEISESDKDLPGEAELALLSEKLYTENGGKKYERVYICYYLPGMEVDAGAWATGHFNPDLEVRIFGTSHQLPYHANTNLRDGMSYEDVCQLMGSEGLRQMNVKDREGRLLTKYRWVLDGTQFDLTFVDNTLTDWKVRT